MVGLTRCFVAEHFKNSKTLHWLSKRPSSTKRRKGSLSQLTKCHLSFGAPGHGKGVWDGLGGTVCVQRLCAPYS